ncbi:hypothetical protein [Sphaerimonospora thailandensis]|uniref:Homeodomain-like domain-containing protein n=1 Tax=Sphaerimonospora thailandensis TaxID=795644 RepID=A0A8J3R9B6_9ACTN|nr:hypothetical protein [Sphaerimonospora thailandensis]GIH70290.1 hypothetical protein Mth01_25430 [Sphaerimonospora thailandensis]
MSPETRAVRHGTQAGYTLDGCRCPRCTKAHRDYQNMRSRQIAYGQWNPLVDADPVREHLALLADQGIGWRRATRLAGVSRYTVHRLLYGTPAAGRPPPKRIKPKTAEKLLAVRLDLDTLPPSSVIDGTATRRRIQALCVVGWSVAEQARQIGMWPANLNAVLTSKRVGVAVARKVRDLTERLWNQPPPETTRSERKSVSYTRGRAARKGWLPLAAWDDDLIDLPDAWLAAELQRRVAEMDLTELARCDRYRREHGERSPLVVAGAEEYRRRRAAARRGAA